MTAPDIDLEERRQKARSGSAPLIDADEQRRAGRRRAPCRVTLTGERYRKYTLRRDGARRRRRPTPPLTRPYSVVYVLDCTHATLYKL